MIRTIRLTILIAMATLLVVSAHAQTWFPVAPESASTTLTIPDGTTYQIGVASCPTANNAPAWSAPVTVTADTTFSPLSMGTADVFPFDDPCQGMLKILQVLETSVAQTLTLNGAPFSVPALASVAPPIALANCPAPTLPNANPTMPSAPPNCAPLANEIPVCADGCSVTDLRVAMPVFFQYCVGSGTARVCAAPFMFDSLPIVVGSNVQCGGPPTANFVSVGTLYVVESDRQTTVYFSAPDGTPQTPILVPIVASIPVPSITPISGGI